MALMIRMPQKGLSEESAILSKWYVKEGDKVDKGEVIFSIETGKATFDVESDEAGTVLKTIGEEGDEIPIKKIVCIIGKPGESYTLNDESAEKKEGTGENRESGTPSKAKDSEALSASESPSVVSAEPLSTIAEKINISPRAMRMALDKGIDYRFARGSGPNGRVIVRDIEAMIVSGPFITDAARPFSTGSENGTGLLGAVTTKDLGSVVKEKEAVTPFVSVEAQPDYETIRISHMRKIIGNNMHNSLSIMAQLTHNSSADATCLQAYRARIKEGAEKAGLGHITINDMVMYAVAHTILDFPELNSHFGDTDIKIFKTVNLGMAVDTPRGLLVPTIMHAEKLSLNELSASAKELAKECQAGNIDPTKLTGASFTVSNLGAFGITSFTPIINPPQTGILGVCNIEYKIRMKNGTPEFYPALNLSLTYDHRACDGAPASRFLQALCRNIENFDLLLVK